ncbi:MAG TPA: hypothetical protein VGE91_02095 [Solirubrobacterales bacterium]
MRRGITLLAVGVVALLPAGAVAGKGHHHKHKPAGVKGVVLNSTCPGACTVEPPPAPRYTGAVTVIVSRASDGVQVASQAVTDGHFRMRVKRGSYDVSSVPPNPPTCEPQPELVCPPPCEPQPGKVCPLSGGRPAAIIAPCLTGETKRVKVRRHRMSRVELHVRNVCVA